MDKVRKCSNSESGHFRLYQHSSDSTKYKFHNEFHRYFSRCLEIENEEPRIFHIIIIRLCIVQVTFKSGLVKSNRGQWERRLKLSILKPLREFDFFFLNEGYPRSRCKHVFVTQYISSSLFRRMTKYSKTGHSHTFHQPPDLHFVNFPISIIIFNEKRVKIE
jgi:hypothetical protein